MCISRGFAWRGWAPSVRFRPLERRNGQSKSDKTGPKCRGKLLFLIKLMLSEVWRCWCMLCTLEIPEKRRVGKRHENGWISAGCTAGVAEAGQESMVHTGDGGDAGAGHLRKRHCFQLD